MKALKPWSEAAQRLVKGGLYRHFKGNDYTLLSVARHSETLEELVVYQAMYGEKGIWVRPLKLFVEEVEQNGKRVPRFALQDT